jgi:hypothetical protein
VVTVVAADRADIPSKIPALNSNCFAVDQAVSDGLSGNIVDSLKSLSRNPHPFSALLLLKAFKILQPNCLQLLNLDNVFFQHVFRYTTGYKVAKTR